jgi:hypothetical protein
MDNQHDVRDKPGDEDTSDQAREREEEAAEREELYAEQYQYASTDFEPARAWYGL